MTIEEAIQKLAGIYYDESMNLADFIRTADTDWVDNKKSIISECSEMIDTLKATQGFITQHKEAINPEQ